jgi:hypothetical protein
MKIYLDPTNNQRYAYEADGSQDALIPDHYVAITQAEADKLTNEEQESEFQSLSTEEKRSMSYPPMADYLDGIVKGDQAQIDKYIADCQAVKAKYPK